METPNKHTKLIVFIIIILAISFIVIKNKSIKKATLDNTLESSEITATSTTKSTDTGQPSKNQILSKNLSATDNAWATFDKYISYAQKHDIEGVKSLIYKFNGTCSKASESEETKKKCFEILDSVYKMGVSTNKASYSNTLSDEKQIILSSVTKETDVGDKIELSKNLIYFTVGNDGTVKILGIENNRTISINKYGLSQDEVNKSLEDDKLDSDSDGLEDKMETCSLNSTNQNCIKTDPNRKDTDGDGFWDSIEPLL